MCCCCRCSTCKKKKKTQWTLMWTWHHQEGLYICTLPSVIEQRFMWPAGLRCPVCPRMTRWFVLRPHSDCIMTSETFSVSQQPLHQLHRTRTPCQMMHHCSRWGPAYKHTSQTLRTLHETFGEILPAYMKPFNHVMPVFSGITPHNYQCIHSEMWLKKCQ